MSLVASPAEIAGKHYRVYDQLFKHADTSKTGTINAQDAASFLHRSNLPITILTKIWDLSDSRARGYLDKGGMFVALKYVALAQASMTLCEDSLKQDLPMAPNMGIDTSIPIADDSTWDIGPDEQLKYDRIFDGLNPEMDKLSGDKVRPVFVNSGLENPLLVKIWELSDIDKDGFLDREEFSLAMHLVYNALNKKAVPSELAESLIPPSKRINVSTLAGSSTNFQTQKKYPDTLDFDISEPIITPMLQAKYEASFNEIDTDFDGLVTGSNLKETFISFGLESKTLMHIWALIDTKGTGALDLKQYIAAMIFIQRALAARGSNHGISGVSKEIPVKTELSVELEKLNLKVESLKREKLTQETDRQQLRADISISNTELLSLEKKCEAVNGNSTQLDCQKLEAQKRLDDLDDRRKQDVKELADIKQKCNEEDLIIEQLNTRLADQAKDEQSQQNHLKQVKDKTSTIRDNEQKLNQQIKNEILSRNELQMKITKMQEEMKQFEMSIESLETSGEEAVSFAGSSSTTCAASPEFDVSQIKSGFDSTPITSGFDSAPITSGFDSAPVKFDSPSAFDTAFDVKPSSNSSYDPFGADPFSNETTQTKPKSQTYGLSNEDFAAFDSAPSANNQFASAFGEDPFASKLSTINPTSAVNDPFASSFTATPSSTSSDPFGQDPFSPSAQSSSSSSAFTSSNTQPSSANKKSIKKKAPTLPPKTQPSSNKKSAPPPRPPAPKGISGTNKSSPFSDDLFSSPRESDFERATRESKQAFDLEQVQRQRQGDADLELALAISRADM